MAYHIISYHIISYVKFIVPSTSHQMVRLRLHEVLRRTGLLVASSIVRKRRLGLLGRVVRLADNVPANQILWTCCEAQDGVRPSPDWSRAKVDLQPPGFIRSAGTREFR